MKLKVLLLLSVLVLLLGFAPAAGATSHEGLVKIVTVIDFSEPPFHGTFEVVEGADNLGCSNGTFVDYPTQHNTIWKVFDCDSGSKEGTFTFKFAPELTDKWWAIKGTEDFRRIRGRGLFRLEYFDEDPPWGIETFGGYVRFLEKPHR